MALKRFDQPRAKSSRGKKRASRDKGDGKRVASVKQLKKAPPLQFEWASAITPDQWQVYREAIDVVRAAGIRFMLGGGFALAMFTGRWRDTKDIDFYIHPKDRDRTVEALTKAGFDDYFSRMAYDRRWIYRSTKANFIVDIIWAMANQRAQVDEAWFDHASSIRIRDQDLKILPMEEFLWCKLYIMQRDHCDWPDVFNLLYANGPYLDWRRLIDRLDEDKPLLRSLLGLYGWLCPKAIRELPRMIWKRLEMSAPGARAERFKRHHIPLLDSRGWFSADQPPGKKLEV